MTEDARAPDDDLSARVGRAAPAHDHVLRRRRLHRAVRSPGSRDVPRAHARLSRRVPRRHRVPVRGSHRPPEGRRHARDLRLPGGARERRRAGGAGRVSRSCERCTSSRPAAAGEPLDVRVAVHHGPVYLDFDEDDIYGLAANVGARLHSLAEPGHRRRLRRGPAARRGPLRRRGRRTADRQGRGRAARALPGDRRAPVRGPAIVVDSAGRARRPSSSGSARRWARGRGRRRSHDRDARARRRGRRQVPSGGRVRRRRSALERAGRRSCTALRSTSMPASTRSGA